MLFMKNKMMKGAHLSERKCKEIIRLFCEDLTATQIADVSGVSRVTINNYLKLIRTHIAKYCEEHNPRYRLAGAFSFMPVHAGAMPAFPDEVLQEDVGWLYGIARHDQKLFVDLLSRQEYDQLLKFEGNPSFPIREIFGERQNRYTALVDIGEWRLTKLEQPSLQSSLRDMDEYDLFWSLTKNRLSKFRGLNRSTAYLHVKECEFRYNYKGEDLLKLLSFIIQRRPLHYSKSSALDS
jgi:transposase